MIAVKTADGSIVPGPVQLVRLPLGGQTTVIIPATGAATLSSAQPNTNMQSIFGFPWLMTGNNGGTCSTCFGVARSVFTFPSVASLIPPGVHLLDSELKVWGMTNNPGGAPSAANYQAHNITQAFTPSQVTWNSAATGTAWTTAGGAFGSATDTGVSGLTNDPNRQEFTVTSAVQSWLGTPSSHHGLSLNVHDEPNTRPPGPHPWPRPRAAPPPSTGWRRAPRHRTWAAPAGPARFPRPGRSPRSPSPPRPSAWRSTSSIRACPPGPGRTWRTTTRTGMWCGTTARSPTRRAGSALLSGWITTRWTRPSRRWGSAGRCRPPP